MNFVSSPNFKKGRDGYLPQAIVLHMTQGSSRSTISWFLNPISEVSAHYLITEDGEIIQFVKEEDTSWHAGVVKNPKWPGLIKGVNPNLYTIGIETALLTPTQIPSWRQWTALARLVKEVCERNNIPIEARNIVNHNEIRADKSCPGIWASRFYVLLLQKLI